LEAIRGEPDDTQAESEREISDAARSSFLQFFLAPHCVSALIDPHLMEAALKSEYTKEFKLHEKDTGSADVQIALLTHRINDLTKHLQKFKKDHSSRRGLLMMVAQRKKLQDYLKKSEPTRYDKVIQKLNLRK
jgi:small subunit ribosomal protein S15